jgi:hypothetical protein
LLLLTSVCAGEWRFHSPVSSCGAIFSATAIRLTVSAALSSIKGEVKKEHISGGRTFSCFAANLIEQKMRQRSDGKRRGENREKAENENIHSHRIVFHIACMTQSGAGASERWGACDICFLEGSANNSMIKERFRELSSQLRVLKERSAKTADFRERRSLLKEMREILKEIDELVRQQTEWNRCPSNQEQP